MCGESPQGMFSTFSLLPAREQFLSGCGPHFSFVLSKEKSPPQRWKRKPLRNELAPHGPTHPKRGARRHELLCISGALLPAAPMQIPRITASPHLVAWHSSGCKEDTPLLLFPLPLSILWGWFPKAGAEAPGLCVVGGPGRSRNALVLFFRGCGAYSFPEKNTPHVPAVETVPCGNRKLCESARHRRALPCYPKS